MKEITDELSDKMLSGVREIMGTMGDKGWTSSGMRMLTDHLLFELLHHEELKHEEFNRD